jgi:hypothetical protein
VPAPTAEKEIKKKNSATVYGHERKRTEVIHKSAGKRMLFVLNYFPRDNSHDQSSKLFKQNQQLDFYVQNSTFICI